MTRPVKESAPDATTALQVTSNAVLSQDVVVSANIIVDATSANPVGCFPNPNRTDASGNFLVEALALVYDDGLDEDQIVYVQRADVETGWQTSPIAGSTGAVEVVAGLSQSGNPMGFYSDGSQLYSITLDPSTFEWSAPTVVYDAPVTNLGVAYDNAGTLITYGKSDDGNLVVASETVSGYTGVKVAVDTCLSNAEDFAVSLSPDFSPGP